VAHIDLKQRAVQAKLVYYGPGLCGKTTNLEYINRHLAKDQELMSLATEGDRTIFFDFMPLELGQLRGLDVRVKLYTVPGQVRYNETRKMVLKNVDGLVFVADSQEQMMDANLESFDNMLSNLTELGMRAEDVAIILQYNKRDLPGVLPPEVLDEALNAAGYPRFLASARSGEGVVETLKESCRQMLRRLMTSLPEREDPKAGAAREAAQVAELGKDRGITRGRQPSGLRAAAAPAPAAQAPAAAPPAPPTPPAPAAPVERRPASVAMPVAPVEARPPSDAQPATPAEPRPSSEQRRERLPSAVGVERRAGVVQAPPAPPAPAPPAPAPPAPAPPAPTPPADTGKLETLQASLAKIVERSSVTERALRDAVEALGKTLEGTWKTDLAIQIVERLPSKTEVQQMGLTLQQLVNQTVGVDLSTLQAQLLHVSAVREEVKALRKSVSELLERPAAGGGVPAADIDALKTRIILLPNKTEFDQAADATRQTLEKTTEALQELRAEIARLPHGDPGTSAKLPQVVERLPGEVLAMREALAGLATKAELAEFAQRVTAAPGEAVPASSPVELTEILQKIAALPDRTELAALREQLAGLPTRAEIAELAAKVAALPGRSELARLGEQLGNLPTKAELAKLVQKVVALPGRAEPVAVREPQPAAAPMAQAKSAAPPAPEPKVSTPPEPVAKEVTPPEPEPEEAAPPAPAPESATSPEPEAPAEPESKPEAPPVAQVEPPPEASPVAPEPKVPAEDPFRDDPAHQNAARVARVMVSDLWLYMKDQVEEGIRQGDFHERLGEALADMRGTYESRVPQAVRDQKDHLGPTILEFVNRKRKQMGLD
jgi:signal recognition particle receptor subunit beta